MITIVKDQSGAEVARLKGRQSAVPFPGAYTFEHVIEADDVRAEASRRMQAFVGARDAAHLEIIIANASREAIRLLRMKAERPWTEAEAARAAQLEAADAAIEAIRAASNAMEDAPPADYAADARWPNFGGT